MSQEEFFTRYSYDAKKDHLGSGGFASVYKAYDSVLDREVAIKVAPYKPGIRSLFDEFDAIRHLSDHKHISNYEDVYKFKLPTGIFEFAVMQYYPMGAGNSLILKDLSQENRTTIANGLILGVNYLHQNKVIHRDLKWNNILISQSKITNKYVPKIADFGLSKRVEEENDSLINNSINAGTYSYLSPENFKIFEDRNKKSLDEKIKFNYDLWAVGIMLYELFIGVVPFPIEKGETNANIARVNQIKAIVNNPIPNEVENVPEPYQEIIKKCLVKNPFDRINSAGLIIEMAEITGLQPSSSKLNGNYNGDDDTIIISTGTPGNDNGKNEGVSVKQSNLLTIILSVLGIVILTSSIFKIMGETTYKFSGKKDSIEADLPEQIFVESKNTPIEYYKSFVAEFNSFLGRDKKFQFYKNHKDSLNIFINNSTTVIENEMKSDLESVIIKHISSASELHLDDMKVNNQGQVELIIFK